MPPLFWKFDGGGADAVPTRQFSGGDASSENTLIFDLGDAQPFPYRIPASEISAFLIGILVAGSESEAESTSMENPNSLVIYTED